MSDELNAMFDLKPPTGQPDFKPSIPEQCAPDGAGASFMSAMTNRYRDGYLVARATTGLGALMKGIGGVLALLIGLGTLVAAGQAPSYSQFFVVLVGVFWAAVVGILFYLLGVLIAAQGQILKATLDSAVNSSPFLGGEEKAKVMSLL